MPMKKVVHVVVQHLIVCTMIFYRVIAQTVRLDALQRTYLMENYSDCLCHDCLKAVKDSFYACEINPRYNKKKNDKESIDCKQR